MMETTHPDGGFKRGLPGGYRARTEVIHWLALRHPTKAIPVPSVTKNGWNRGFLRDAVDAVDRYKACISITSAYPMDGNDGFSCVFKSNGRRSTSTVGSIPTYSRQPTIIKGFEV